MRACSAGSYAAYDNAKAAYEDNVLSWPSVEPADDYTAISLLAFLAAGGGVRPWHEDTDTDNPPAAVLAIDGGNSKTDVALVADDGTLLAKVRGPGASHEDFGLGEAMRRLDEAVHLAAERAGAPSGRLIARHTSACLAGADLPEEEAQLTAAIQRQGWSLTSAAANDTFAVLRAGLTPAEGERPWGVAVTCGKRHRCVRNSAPDGAHHPLSRLRRPDQKRLGRRPGARPAGHVARDPGRELTAAGVPAALRDE